MDLFEIIMKVAPKVEENPHVHAMWLEGSYATGKNSEQSDIDVWMDVDDGTFEYCVVDFRKKLNEVVAIKDETTKRVYSSDPNLYKLTFILRGYKEGQDVELDLQEHSRKFVFSRSEHTIKILFDKDQTIKWSD